MLFGQKNVGGGSNGKKKRNLWNAYKTKGLQMLRSGTVPEPFKKKRNGRASDGGGVLQIPASVALRFRFFGLRFRFRSVSLQKKRNPNGAFWGGG